jgi:hypothetical protein
MPRWDTEPLVGNDPRLVAARKLLRKGHLTMGEAAALVGYTRQHMHRLTQDLQPVRRRAAYLKQLWRQALEDA